MATRGAWIKAKALLKMVYGRLVTDDTMRSLHSTLDDLPDDILIGAVGRHIDNDEQNGKHLAGEWCPKPAQVRFHANALIAESDKSRRHEIAAREEAIRQTAERQPARTVQFEGGAEFGLTRELTVSPAECPDCRDSGFAWYWCPRERSTTSNPDVYLREEFDELPEASRKTFERFPAVCDCRSGRVRRDRSPAAHSAGVECNGRVRQLYITVELARKMSQKRQHPATEQGALL